MEAARLMAEISTGGVALRDDAQTRAENIRTRLESLTANFNEIPVLIEEAYRAKDWEALGYPDWPSYVHSQYDTHIIELDKAVRRKWARDLKAVGLTTREIAPVTNVSKATAARDAASSEAAQASQDGNGVIDAEVISDTADASKALDKLRMMVERTQTGIGYLTGQGTLPDDLTAEQAAQWHGLICGRRGKGNAGLAKQLHDFADKLNEAYSLK